jgi:hypothetical protein
MTMARMTWSAVKDLMLRQGSLVGPECMDAVRTAMPDDSARETDVGFPLASDVLDIYRYFRGAGGRRRRTSWHPGHQALGLVFYNSC